MKKIHHSSHLVIEKSDHAKAIHLHVRRFVSFIVPKLYKIKCCTQIAFFANRLNLTHLPQLFYACSPRKAKEIRNLIRSSRIDWKNQKNYQH